jgi:hypothetical protein
LNQRKPKILPHATPQRRNEIMIDAFANSARHARMALSDIQDFKDLKAGFQTKTASGMTFCETVKIGFCVASLREVVFRVFSFLRLSGLSERSERA